MRKLTYLTFSKSLVLLIIVMLCLVTQSSLTLCDPMDYIVHQAPLSMGLSKQKHWSGLPCLLQGIFPTQGLYSGLLHCRQILYHLSHQESPDGTVAKCYWFYHKTLSHSYTFLSVHTAAAAKLLQLSLTLCDPIDVTPPGSSIPGISRQEYLNGLSFPFPIHACMLSHFSLVQLSETLWTAAHQAPLSTWFSRQGYWSGLPFPSPFNF